MIIKHRETVNCVTYYHAYFYPGTESGFQFPCDANGKIEPLQPAGQENLDKCLNGTYNVVDAGVIKFEHSYTTPAVCECACGCEVELSGFTNTCDRCNRDYNMSGQLLAPRECWGEETGEHLADILRIR
jgi:hypothetical protein